MALGFNCFQCPQTVEGQYFQTPWKEALDVESPRPPNFNVGVPPFGAEIVLIILSIHRGCLFFNIEIGGAGVLTQMRFRSCLEILSFYGGPNNIAFIKE